jgi:hypothetical protein
MHILLFASYFDINIDVVNKQENDESSLSIIQREKPIKDVAEMYVKRD